MSEENTMNEDLTKEELKENVTEDTTEEELTKTMQQSPTFRQCRRDIPRFVVPQLRTTEEAEKNIKNQKETDERQRVETILNTTMKLCENNVNKNSLSSTYELMFAKDNPDLKKTYQLPQLNANMQNIKDFIEDITNSENVETERIGEEAKSRYDKTGTIIHVNAMGNATLLSKKWDLYVSEVEGDLAVLEMGKRICQPILESYIGVIARRDDKRKISQITAKMVDIARQGEKIKPSIRRENEQAEKTIAKGRQCDIKTASAYINALTKFKDLNDQYSNLKIELRYFTNEPLNITEFPGLASTDISADHDIQKTWRLGSA